MKMGIIYLAAGCFWGAQRFFDCLEGVVSTEVGYANGMTPNPTYEQVKSGGTGYAETVSIEYDKSIISLTDILDLYFKIIDPTSINRQGGDVGEQYRTGIFYVDESDRTVIDGVVSGVQKQHSKPLAVQVMPLKNFFTAEQYHQKYIEKNPGGYCHITPEMMKMAENYRKQRD